MFDEKTVVKLISWDCSFKCLFPTEDKVYQLWTKVLTVRKSVHVRRWLHAGGGPDLRVFYYSATNQQKPSSPCNQAHTGLYHCRLSLHTSCQSPPTYIHIHPGSPSRGGGGGYPREGVSWASIPTGWSSFQKRRGGRPLLLQGFSLNNGSKASSCYKRPRVASVSFGA
jgi:hypothetical protein